MNKWEISFFLVLIGFSAFFGQASGSQQSHYVRQGEVLPLNQVILPVLQSNSSPNYPEWWYVKMWWVGYPMLKRACSCESWGNPDKEPRQFREDGTLLIGYPNPNDVGACQINLPIWGEKAKEMGLDVINNFFDNITMAKYILSVQGMDAWKYSRKCWSVEKLIVEK